jgi:hypothetical protein
MDPLRLFRRSRDGNRHPQPHMTWASRSISDTITRTGVFLKRRIWVWPIIAVVVLSAIGFGVRRAIESTMKGNLRSGLQTLLSVETAMLENWFEVQKSNAETLANDVQVRESVYQLFDDTDAPADAQVPLDAQVHQQLSKELAPAMSSHDYVGYFVVDKSKRIRSSSYAALIGQQEVAEYNGFLTRALDGETVVCPPFPSVVMMKTESGKVRMGEPTMYACAPVRDATFQVVAALALQIRPEREFTRILQLGRVGESGETYAFNKDGVLVSNSRFDEDLILLGLLPDQEESHSILSVLVRDPGGDVTQGYRPTVRRAQLPLTRMAVDAVAGNSDVDVEGYRDYRGVPVVGAWSWMPKYEIGVATEVDVAQAFRPLVILRRTFWTLYALLILSAVAIFVFTVIVARMQRNAQKAAIESRKLGQYTLEEKLGTGAMGVVYKGHHAMLRRPTAIKMLDVDKVNDTSIARFEREVQITCQLNHPNTIAIYDYGRTPEGVFYYAMEYLDGIDLQTLVDDYGPQAEHRVIHILLQMCGSLYEAHSHGLVHRDIKPANVMLNRRGCEPDVVKVLDFGLVKAIDEQKQSRQTVAGALTGTPLYMSPEAIDSPLSVDARSDIYAVGAVGYFLMTGEPVFSAESLVELCQRQVDEAPLPPSERLGKEVSAELENALLACLEKSRAKRPQTARDLVQLLEKCPAAGSWTIEEADAWWGRHERGRSPSEQSFIAAEATFGPYEQTIDGALKHTDDADRAGT